ncbi:formate dehydrogenase subunit gamma [Helicobacter enhydrae]|uniref:Formate dehydrogenase subunit gamma n=1 Tax=Helicobacter enhydrae TaxID=222136 RepID=A0A1B1U535_9HELI|nr:formate dehydrogenase subunit gamma [Helicobacter enhydrae]ANV97869.1 formate dehydrogenase subunit gamma [Helicobacter enhydrae]
MRGISVLLFLFLFLSGAFANEKQPNFSQNTEIYGVKQIEQIKNWGWDSPTAGVIGNTPQGVAVGPLDSGKPLSGIQDAKGLGELFTLLQNKFFAPIFLAIIVLVPVAFATHLMLFGSKRFAHGVKYKIFSTYNIAVHWLTAVPFIVICITGLIMVFGAQLGGGLFVRLARDLHAISTLAFVVFGPLMFLMWVKASLPKSYDLKWLLMLGGYLTKGDTIKTPIPSGQFNAGMKMWFWVCTIGGFVMVITGAIMYFQFAPINALRLSAIIHNVLGFAIIALLITHIYMAVFAIEGALSAMVDGTMGEEELAILHSCYYQELQASGELERKKVAHS